MILLLSRVLRCVNSSEATLSVTAAVRAPDDQSLHIISPTLRGRGHLNMSAPDTASRYNRH